MDIKNGLVRGFLKVLGGFWAARIDTPEITADSIKGAEIDAVKSNISNLQATATQLNSQLTERYYTKSEINTMFASYTLRLTPHTGEKGFDNYITQGQYQMADNSGTSKGNPHDGYCYGVLFVHISTGTMHNGVSNWMFQEFWSTNNRIYRRQKINDGAWFAWTMY